MPFIKSRVIGVTTKRVESSKRNGLRHAIFTIIPVNKIVKKRYTGEWKDDKKHGKGSEFNMYESLSDDFKHTGLLYEGDWANDLRHGYGVLSRVSLGDKTRVKIYSGNWVNNKRQGFGGFWYKNGSYYEGYFMENKRHGFGRMWINDGTFYQGDWIDDLYHGQGMLVLANGNRYEGHFWSGDKEDRGLFYHILNGQLQEGYWLSNDCRTSTMEDTYWRQSAPTPTPYPIPKLLLRHQPLEILESRKEELSLLRTHSFPSPFIPYSLTPPDCLPQ